MAFRGTFDHTLDAKNRLTIPAKFRATLADGVILAKPDDGTPCLQIWPAAEYEGMTAAALAGRDPLHPDVKRLKRFYSMNAWDTELDAAGRVNLPRELIKHAGLTKDVVVTGAADCLEVWDREAGAAYNEDLVARVPDITASLARSS